jgi:hypothetical protein
MGAASVLTQACRKVFVVLPSERICNAAIDGLSCQREIHITTCITASRIFNILEIMMSNFRSVAFNPKSGRAEMADWLDDYFGRHKYGLRFSDGGVYDPKDVELPKSPFGAGLRGKDALMMWNKMAKDFQEEGITCTTVLSLCGLLGRSTRYVRSVLKDHPNIFHLGDSAALRQDDQVWLKGWQ